ncbi:radical SAM protein [Pseudodonghicola xiamenensis]|uniref:Radical SAM core domain-containing protein n=1 Tax=Pseudodonghicola xiamenensis TaxID=337702 RepID=A0A8J3H9X1_9RHOB|nr:radical SAM protein [Pseudodonghicola xiamenensis]GHG94749.1 hypothetical protein GCM10010961_27940 [Pseudodonghicola xiamenensis]
MKDSSAANIGKFTDPAKTATGQERASVRLNRLETLWFNTGTLCNITCANCYINSSPTNDALVYISAREVSGFLDQLASGEARRCEIGFTGGEPFMNPQMIALAETALTRGHQVLILTNAMQPMMRPKVKAGLVDLAARFGDRLTLRVSLDHHGAARHDAERGSGSFERTLKGMDWLTAQGIRMTVAGRSLWHEDAATARAGYAALFAARGYDIDAFDPGQTLLFPEMDLNVEVPEITTACWDILKKSPDTVMCASSRMVVKRRGARLPTVVACTLLPYDPQFDLGETLAAADRPVALNHPHCAKFCVLGGASCSA